MMVETVHSCDCHCAWWLKGLKGLLLAMTLLYVHSAKRTVPHHPTQSTWQRYYPSVNCCEYCRYDIL